MSDGYFEVLASGDPSHLRPRDLVGACFEHDTRGLLVGQGALPAGFFDLSTGVAGELMQHLANYGIRMAAVVPDLTQLSGSFQDFAREANRTGQARFLPDRDQAVEWLTTAS